MNYKLSEKFPKKRAFITGSASGLGKGLCKELAKDNWTIVMSDIQEDSLEKSAEEIRNAGATVLTYKLDVGNFNQYQEVVKDVEGKIGGIDLLINNAGVGDGNLLLEYKVEDWEWLLRINLLGVLYGFKLLIDQMSTQKSGHIISISSAASFTSAPGMSAYNVSKAGVTSLAETMFYELHPYNVGVSVVMPTFFKTNVMQFARGNEYVHNFAKYMMDHSKTNIEDMAQVVLNKAGKNKLYIVHPKEARVQWFLKKFFPGYLRKQILKNIEKIIGKRIEEV